MENINPIIGIDYYYPSDKQRQKFKVKSFSKFVVEFECGHWCTDNVFIDLLPVKAIQMKIDFNYLE